MWLKGMEGRKDCSNMDILFIQFILKAISLNFTRLIRECLRLILAPSISGGGA